MARLPLELLACALLASATLACESKGSFGPYDGGCCPDAAPALGGFEERPIDVTFRHGQGIELADVDRDGDLDVAIALSLTDSVHLYLNLANETFATHPLGVPGSLVATDVAIADLDGDDDLDIAAVGLFDRSAGASSPGELVWFENPGIALDDWRQHAVTGKTLWGARFVEAADLNGDARADLIVSAVETTDAQGQPQGNGVHYLLSNGRGSFSAMRPVDAALRVVTTVLATDLDGDGVTDLLAAGNRSDEVAWYRNERTGVADPSFTRRVIGSVKEPFSLALTNRDMDATPELYVGGSDGLRLFDATETATGTWTSSVVAPDFQGQEMRLAVADFDGDERLDVAASTQDQGLLRLFLDREARWLPIPVAEGYTGVTFVVTGDLDADGLPDLVTSTYDHDATDRLSWWRNLR